MSYDDRLGDYNDVASRMREFFEKYPDGRLRPASPWRVETVGDKQFVVYEAAAYRGPDDSLPGIGTAWEPFPGRTPYTRDSELMNAETSAWGRAILAVGAADTKKGIASAEEVRNRTADREHDDQSQQRNRYAARMNFLANAREAIPVAESLDHLAAVESRIESALIRRLINDQDLTELSAAVQQRRLELEAEALSVPGPQGEQAQMDLR